MPKVELELAGLKLSGVVEEEFLLLPVAAVLAAGGVLRPEQAPPRPQVAPPAPHPRPPTPPPARLARLTPPRHLARHRPAPPAAKPWHVHRTTPSRVRLAAGGGQKLEQGQKEACAGQRPSLSTCCLGPSYRVELQLGRCSFLPCCQDWPCGPPLPALALLACAAAAEGLPSSRPHRLLLFFSLQPLRTSPPPPGLDPGIEVVVACTCCCNLWLCEAAVKGLPRCRLCISSFSYLPEGAAIGLPRHRPSLLLQLFFNSSGLSSSQVRLSVALLHATSLAPAF